MPLSHGGIDLACPVISGDTTRGKVAFGLRKPLVTGETPTYNLPRMRRVKRPSISQNFLWFLSVDSLGPGPGKESAVADNLEWATLSCRLKTWGWQNLC